jgi:putative transposase
MQGEYRRSERRACQLAGVGRSSCRYRAQRRDDPELRERLRELAGERRSGRAAALRDAEPAQ